MALSGATAAPPVAAAQGQGLTKTEQINKQFRAICIHVRLVCTTLE